MAGSLIPRLETQYSYALSAVTFPFNWRPGTPTCCSTCFPSASHCDMAWNPSKPVIITLQFSRMPIPFNCDQSYRPNRAKCGG